MLLQRERVKAPGELSKAKDEPPSEEEVKVVVRYVE